MAPGCTYRILIMELKDKVIEWAVDKKEIASIIKFMLTRPDDITLDQMIIHKFYK